MSLMQKPCHLAENRAKGKSKGPLMFQLNEEPLESLSEYISTVK